MTDRIQSYLSGTWQSGNETGSTLVNPVTEEAIATADTSGLDFGAALAFARTEGGPALRELTFTQRATLLQNMSTALHGAREMLIESAIVNGGCTRGDAKFDIDGAIGTLAAYAEIGRELGDVRILADGEGIQLGRSPRFWGQHIYTSKLGAAVFINAFNFPTWGFAEKAACALLGGMPVITKPATATAHTAWKMTQVLVDSTHMPPGTLSFVGGRPGDLLDHLNSQDVLAFTGSADTAKHLRQHPRVIAQSVPVNVEADSLNAAVLGPDVESGSEAISLFAKDICRDMTQKTGQKCTATRRIFVPKDSLEAATEALIEQLADIRIGDPRLREVRMGPVASARQLDDVCEGVKRLSSESKPIFGQLGRPNDLVGIDNDKGYFHPILLMRCDDSAQAKHVHTHEVFGPVATIIPYSGKAQDAVALVAKGEGGLVSSVFSDDRKFLEEMTIGLAPYHGRIYLGGEKVAEYATGPGLVLPTCVHGGPGRAGAGEELGGVRGVHHFMQRTAVQGYRPLVEKITGTKKPAAH
jgi:3,4-dehydroadipyl-CoA semialdehyde dehydrogenase